jgi:hypothetical protein
LVELIVLNVGLETGVINETVFAIMVLMAVFTTLMTTPLILYIYPPQYFRKTMSDYDEDTSMSLSDELDNLGGQPLRPLLCLPGLRFVPCMMNLTKMIVMPMSSSTTNPAAIQELTIRNAADVMKGVDRTLESSSKASSVDCPTTSILTTGNDVLVSTIAGKRVPVHAVRMIETNERSSSIMRALTQQVDALKDDPVLNVFTAFGQYVHHCIYFEKEIFFYREDIIVISFKEHNVFYYYNTKKQLCFLTII